MKRLILLPLLLGFSVPAIAHNEFNGGEVGAMGVSNVPTRMKNPHARNGYDSGNPSRAPLTAPFTGEGADAEEGKPADCVAPCGDNTDGKAAKLRAKELKEGK